MHGAPELGKALVGSTAAGICTIICPGALRKPGFFIKAAEAFETETRWGFSQVGPWKRTYKSVEEAERKQLCRARGSDDGAGHG